MPSPHEGPCYSVRRSRYRSDRCSRPRHRTAPPRSRLNHRHRPRFGSSGCKGPHRNYLRTPGRRFLRGPGVRLRSFRGTCRGRGLARPGRTRGRVAGFAGGTGGPCGVGARGRRGGGRRGGRVRVGSCIIIIGGATDLRCRRLDHRPGLTGSSRDTCSGNEPSEASHGETLSGGDDDVKRSTLRGVVGSFGRNNR